MSKKINIPNPCGEDWSKMTPTEKGAFCDKCAFEVIDFTDQSPEEIRDTLKIRSGQKTCGHISKMQLQILNTNYHMWEEQSIPQFRSKFLYACLMVFGFTLFTSCGGSSNEEEEIKVGMIGNHEEMDVGMLEEDTTYNCDVIEGELTEDDYPVDGMMEVIDEDEEVVGKMLDE